MLPCSLLTVVHMRTEATGSWARVAGSGPSVFSRVLWLPLTVQRHYCWLTGDSKQDVGVSVSVNG